MTDFNDVAWEVRVRASITNYNRLVRCGACCKLVPLRTIRYYGVGSDRMRSCVAHANMKGI